MCVCVRMCEGVRCVYEITKSIPLANKNLKHF